MTTIINCPSCGAAYDIPDLATIAGRKVRCRSCANVWRVEAPVAAKIELTATPGALTRASTGASLSRESSKSEAKAVPPAPPLSPAATDAVPVTIALGRARDEPSAKVNGHAAAPVDTTPPLTERERRRIGRRASGFDEVEAAIAALQSSIQEQDAAPATAPAPARERPDFSRFDVPARPANDAGGYRPLSDAPPLDDDPFPPDSGIEDELRSRRLAAGIAWISFVAVLAGLSAFAWIDRRAVVRTLPGSAAIYTLLGAPVNVRGLEVSSVDTLWQIDPRGRPVLSVTGQVANVSHETQAVPSVVIAFLDADGRELFDWATPVGTTSLPPGQSMPFTTVVPAPPDAVRSLEIRFAKARR